MEIRILATGSSGNCYIVDDGATPIMLECGISFKTIMRMAGGILPRHCLVTHEHGDHAKSAADLVKNGIELYASAGTLAAINLLEEGTIISHKKPIKIGTFSITPLNAVHDAKEPLMFYMTSEATRESLLFATDTCEIPYQFRPVTHLMIEVNHDETLIEQNSFVGRILQNHMSLQDAIEYIETINKSMLHAIYLIHPSRDNLDLALAKRVLQEASGVPVFTK